MSSIIYFYEILAVLSIISGFIVVSALNPIHRVVWLIIVFTLGAFMFILLDYYFLGLTYIIVYVGAIAILFLFVIMMVQVHFTPTLKRKELESKIAVLTTQFNHKKLNILKLLMLSLVLLLGAVVLYYIYSNMIETNIMNYFYTNWTMEFKTLSDIESLAQMIYLAYPTALLLISIILWAVMIGIIKITIK